MKTQITKIIENSMYSLDEILLIDEYNAKQYEVEMWDPNTSQTYYLDINLYEKTMCVIDPKTRRRSQFETI